MSDIKTYINVLSLIGRDIPITLADGNRLRDEVSRSINSGATVMLDFTGVSAVGSPFVNNGLGQLLEHFDLNELLFHVEFIGASPRVASMLWTALDNAQLYHRGSSRYRDIVNLAVMESAG